MKISVIIPAYNEAKTIHRMLENLCTQHEPGEVIVVDGGSTDQTRPLAREWAKVISAPKGRARQMNEGAKHASGDVFLFLHADTFLPEHGIDLIRETLLQGRRCGRFRMRFDDRRFLLRLYEIYTRFHLFSYGDQGFFVKRELFGELAGFREDVPFEDIDFYRRLCRITKPVILKAPVTTSARRFRQAGCWRQKGINLFLVGLYSMGFNVLPIKKKWYQDVR